MAAKDFSTDSDFMGIKMWMNGLGECFSRWSVSHGSIRRLWIQNPYKSYPHGTKVCHLCSRNKSVPGSLQVNCGQRSRPTRKTDLVSSKAESQDLSSDHKNTVAHLCPHKCMQNTYIHITHTHTPQKQKPCLFQEYFLLQPRTIPLEITTPCNVKEGSLDQIMPTVITVIKLLILN